MFRKIFDETPTELALDMMGISRIWKSENISTAKVEKNSNKNQSDKFDDKNKVERLNNKVAMNFGQQSPAKINNISKEDDVIFPRRTKGFEIQYPKWQPKFMDKTPWIINKKIQENLKESIKKADYNLIKINKDHQFIKDYYKEKDIDKGIDRERFIKNSFKEKVFYLSFKDFYIKKSYLKMESLGDDLDEN